MSRFFNKQLQDLKPYIPGEQPQDKHYIKLNTNESPYPPAPGVLAALKSEAGDLNLYPDPEATDLVGALSLYYGIKTENILTGNGSDEILTFAFMAFGERDRGIALPDITYGLYAIYAKLFGIPAFYIPLKEDFSLDIEAFMNVDKTLIIANPNAPTCLLTPVSQLERLLAARDDRVVIIDEAYIDFGGQSCLPLINKYDNLLIIRTFSKSRALAGARLGVAFGCKELIQDLHTIKYSFNPYNVNRLTLAAGVAAIKDEIHFRVCRDAIIETRDKTIDSLRELGMTVSQSYTNFLFVRPDFIPAARYAARLKEKGILIRYFPGERTGDFVRISVGLPEEMQALITATADLIKEEKP